jgi:FkbM family methyltransferase
LSDARVIFDVGASTGLFRLITAADGEYREVHAFESVPKTYLYLLRNIAANGLQNIKAVQACVGSFDGEQPCTSTSRPRCL